MKPKKPLVLCILDGVGSRKETKGNAVKAAHLETLTHLWNKYPHSLLSASGEDVGLPEGQMGNSEVGHINIGAGRIVYQPLEIINKSIKDQTIFTNKEILGAINYAKEHKSTLHIMGLLSDGGVHSHLDHLLAILDICKKENMNNLSLHLFTDGRDTLPNVASKYIDILEPKLTDLGRISTISGRYYAMDRDNRWDRVKLYYDAITLGKGNAANNAKEAIETSYKNNLTDEFIMPTVIDKTGVIKDNDAIIVFNFRPDRLRELYYALTNKKFKEFKRSFIKNLKLVTMMKVSPDLVYSYAFDTPIVTNTLGEVIANHKLNQLRIAETEKYNHVTYFFDGEMETKLKQKDQILIKSPQVATYDLKPEMSAFEVTEKLLEVIDKYDVIILNYANGDMVGHTGNFDATVKALESVDSCLKKIYNKVLSLDGILIITADHGNADYMLDDNNQVITSHSLNKVPFLICKEGLTLNNGRLCDIAPTILSLLNIDKPKEMTGVSLLEKKL